jgi:hypothetical protein
MLEVSRGGGYKNLDRRNVRNLLSQPMERRGLPDETAGHDKETGSCAGEVDANIAEGQAELVLTARRGARGVRNLGAHFSRTSSSQ